MKNLLPLVVAICVAFASCSNNRKPGPRAAELDTSPGFPGGSPATTSSARDSTSPKTTPSSSATKPSRSSSATQESDRSYSTDTAVLERKCARAGIDRQGLTVRTKPQEYVGFSSAYSDGSNELTNPTYKTGYGYGTSDGKGLYSVKWLVPASAPAGPAKVYVVGQSPKPIELIFTVASSTGSCS